jgi:hypothetical protein
MGDPAIQILAESESFSIWQTDDPDGETTFHLELGSVTVHLFREELQELLALMHEAEGRVAER